MNFPDFSSIKMVVSDMDGTLLNSEHQVSDQFFELFEELKSRGVLFVAASGRQYDSIVEKLQPIFDHIYFIAENGGMIKKNDQELLSIAFPKELVAEPIELLERHTDINTVLCTRKSAYIRSDQKHFKKFVDEYYTSTNYIDNLMDCPEEIIKIALYHADGSEKNIYPKVKQFENRLQVKISGPNWVDLSHLNCNKGYALQKLQEHLGISKEQTMVFGDYNNDLEMFAQARYSIAMENSHPNVLKVATHQTSSNNNFGVEKVLEKLIRDHS